MRPERVLFFRGCRGQAALEIQRGLEASGYAVAVDGDFGARTEAALKTWQSSRGADATGRLTVGQWSELARLPAPSLFERCLGLTAQFEGHGFGKLAGNFDGAGLTWGIIGFNLKSGSLGEVLKRVSDPVLVASFGRDNARELRTVTGWSDWNARVAWAIREAVKPNGEPLDWWAKGFTDLGATPEARNAQLAVARENYWAPAVETAGPLEITSEAGYALLFDRQVQQGGITRSQANQIARRISGERARLEGVARVMCRGAWAADILARCRAILDSTVQAPRDVHGFPVVVEAFGISRDCVAEV